MGVLSSLDILDSSLLMDGCLCGGIFSQSVLGLFFLSVFSSDEQSLF